MRVLGESLRSAGQISLVIALSLALAVAAAVGLTLAKFSDALSEAVEARYRIHAADVRSSIETGLNLGLQLEEIAGNVQVIVRSRLDLDGNVLRIVVTEADGGEVFALGREAPRPDEAGLANVTLPIVNSFGQTAGAVTVTYSVGSNRQTLLDAARTLTREAAAIWLVAVATASFGCILVMSALPPAIRRARSRLEAAEADAPPDGEPRGEIERAARDAAVAARETVAELAAIERQVGSADGRRT